MLNEATQRYDKLLCFNYRKLSFAFLLPAVELLVWSKLVVEPALLMFIRFHFADRFGNAEINSQQFQIIVPRSNWLAFSFETACRQNFHTIMNINLPGALIGAPLTAFVLPVLRKHAVPFAPQLWNTLSLPFFCLPVWWFIGRVLDQLIAGARPRVGGPQDGHILFTELEKTFSAFE